MSNSLPWDIGNMSQSRPRYQPSMPISRVSPYTSFVLSPLPACFTTEQSTVEASLSVNFVRSVSSRIQTDKKVWKKQNLITCNCGSRDGAVVRAPASHQCGPGSIPGLSVICGLSLLLVLVLAPRVFSPGTPVFLPPQKTNISKFQLDLEFESSVLT